MIEDLIARLGELAQVLPLELFVFLGSIIEELVSPIPSPIVTTTAGLAVAASGINPWFFAYLALVATTAKTAASLIIYWLGDKAEDLILIRLGPRLGINHAQVEAVGRRFSGSWKDYLTLMVIRIVPFFPTFVVSIAAGVIKLNLRLYVTGTLIGNYFRSLIFMLLGYFGFEATGGLVARFDSLESWLEILLVAAALTGLVWLYQKRPKK